MPAERLERAAGLAGGLARRGRGGTRRRGEPARGQAAVGPARDRAGRSSATSSTSRGHRKLVTIVCGERDRPEPARDRLAEDVAASSRAPPGRITRRSRPSGARQHSPRPAEHQRARRSEAGERRRPARAPTSAEAQRASRPRARPRMRASASRRPGPRPPRAAARTSEQAQDAHARSRTARNAAQVPSAAPSVSSISVKRTPGVQARIEARPSSAPPVASSTIGQPTLPISRERRQEARCASRRAARAAPGRAATAPRKSPRLVARRSDGHGPRPLTARPRCRRPRRSSLHDRVCSSARPLARAASSLLGRRAAWPRARRGPAPRISRPPRRGSAGSAPCASQRSRPPAVAANRSPSRARRTTSPGATASTSGSPRGRSPTWPARSGRATRAPRLADRPAAACGRKARGRAGHARATLRQPRAPRRARRS